MTGLLQGLGKQAMDAAPSLRPASRSHATAMQVNEQPLAVVDAGPLESAQPARDRDERRADRAIPARDAPSLAARPNARTQERWHVHVEPGRTNPMRSGEESNSPASRPRSEEPAPATPAASPGRRPESTIRVRAPAVPMAEPPADPARVRAANAAARQPADVHIHIGRIEVIAAAPAPAPKRDRPAPASKSLSLEDYLRRGAKPA